MAEKQIVVNYTEGSSSLSIEPHDPTIKDLDWVWWRFAGIPSYAYGIILFDAGLGPFQTVRSYRDPNQWLLAKGNTGIQGHYPYRAHVIVPGESTARASGEGVIRNEAVHENRSPKVHVTYLPPVTPGAEGTLEVKPFPLQLFDGDTAIWEVENLPLGSFLNFKFDGILSPPSGPFAAVYTILEHSSERKIHGTGFAVAGQSEVQFVYELELRNEAGQIIARTDPQIDRLPPPPDGL